MTNTAETCTERTRRINELANTARVVVRQTIDRLLQNHCGSEAEHEQTLATMLLNELGVRRKFSVEMDPHGLFIALEKALPSSTDDFDRRLILADLLWGYVDDFCVRINDTPQPAQAA